MFEFMKDMWYGFMVGCEYNKLRIKESKWYIIPVVINTILILPLTIIALLVCLTKRGRMVVTNTTIEMLEEVEESMET